MPDYLIPNELLARRQSSRDLFYMRVGAGDVTAEEIARGAIPVGLGSGAVGGGVNDGFATAGNEDTGLDLTLWDQGTNAFRRIRLENGALIVVA